MANMTASDLLDWLARNLFLPAPRVEELRSSLAVFADAHALAKELIKRDWLTPYQVNQILQGKGEQLIVGGNLLLERLGEGSMGQVFKAWNTRLGRVVAVKMVHKEYFANNRALERFRREVATAAQLDHPNIVLVRDADVANDRPFMVMDYIAGQTLSHRVKQSGPLGIPEAVEYVRQAALGLQHAYERGVVHRDIKPGNLIVARSADDQPLVKILDFGLARFDSEERNEKRLTFSGNLLGTVDYIAPEQAQDAHTADIRADIYSLGCTLYYLLTAAPPFPGSTVVEKIMARTGGPTPSVRAVRGDVPAELDAVLQKMMARSPAERYQTPLEVAEALGPFAREASLAEPAKAWCLDSSEAAPPAAVPIAVPVTAPLPPGTPVAHALPVAAAPVAEAPPIPEAVPLGPAPWPYRPDDLFRNEAPVSDARPREVLADESGMPSAAQAATTGIPLADDAVPPTAADAAAVETVASAAPALSRTAVGRKSSSQPWLLWIAGCGFGLLLLAAVVTFVVQLSGGSGASGHRGSTYPPGAELRLKPLKPIVLNQGDRKGIIVGVQRKDFTGPVRVYFEKLPDGFGADEIKLSDTATEGQFYLTVSFG
ncbi:MAG: protein kinase, partial [Gemmataceae bacterium]|nr:protein kinase [Gemmataceae bacterium]